jgi:hypothetical protein
VLVRLVKAFLKPALALIYIVYNLHNNLKMSTMSKLHCINMVHFITYADNNIPLSSTIRVKNTFMRRNHN